MASKTNYTDRHGNKRYRLTKVVGHKLNDKGKEIAVRKSFYGKNKSEAVAKYEEYKIKKEQGIETKTQYFGILADNWISEFFYHDGSLADSTKYKYIKTWNRHFKPMEFYNYPLNEVTAKTLQKGFNDLLKNGCPVSEIKTIRKLLRKFYAYIETEQLGRDMTRHLTIPKEDKNAAGRKIITWTDEEINTIMSNFDKADNRFRHRFLIVLAFYTGCRKSELLALKYSDIDDDGVHITKQLADISDGLVDGKMKTHVGITDPKTNNSVRTIAVDPVVYTELKRHKAWHKAEMLKNGYRTDYIFTTESGNFYNEKNLDVALSRYYKKIGIEPKTLHTYRRTYATLLCRQGIEIETVRDMLGHESTETTARFYVSVGIDKKEAAALVVGNVLTAHA